MKLRVAPESNNACTRKARIETDRWISFELREADVVVSVACLSTPTSAGAETSSFPTWEVQRKDEQGWDIARALTNY
jgi:hypothetical protein